MFNVNKDNGIFEININKKIFLAIFLSTFLFFILTIFFFIAYTFGNYQKVLKFIDTKSIEIEKYRQFGLNDGYDATKLYLNSKKSINNWINPTTYQSQFDEINIAISKISEDYDTRKSKILSDINERIRVTDLSLEWLDDKKDEYINYTSLLATSPKDNLLELQSYYSKVDYYYKYSYDKRRNVLLSQIDDILRESDLILSKTKDIEAYKVIHDDFVKYRKEVENYKNNLLPTIDNEEIAIDIRKFLPRYEGYLKLKEGKDIEVAEFARAEERRKLAEEEQRKLKELIGDRKIVVNLTSQKLYAYEGDNLLKWSYVTTGKDSTPTVTGNFALYAKQPSVYLTGRDAVTNKPYKVFVDYWMPFYSGYGIHDAYRWRTVYGGSDYHYAGSHGCVNTPLDMVKFIWDWAPVGTPVIVTY